MKENEHEIWHTEYKESVEAGSLGAVARELARYKLDSVGVQDIRCNMGVLDS